MAAEQYYGETMTLSISTAGDAATIPVGIIQDVEIVIRAEHDELRGADSTLREDVQKRDFEVEVTAAYQAWDDTFVQQWLSGSGTSTDQSQTYTDSSNVALFDVDGSVTSTESAGQTTTNATVTDVYFPELPLFTAEREGYVENSITGFGKDIDLT